MTTNLFCSRTPESKSLLASMIRHDLLERVGAKPDVV